MNEPANHPAGVPFFEMRHRLARALELGGVTRAGMAEHLGLSDNTIRNYLSGRTTPSRSTVRDWSMRCGVPTEWVLTGDVTLPGPPADGEALDRRKTGRDLRKPASTCIHVGAGVTQLVRSALLPVAA